MFSLLFFCVTNFVIILQMITQVFTNNDHTNTIICLFELSKLDIDEINIPQPGWVWAFMEGGKVAKLNKTECYL